MSAGFLIESAIRIGAWAIAFTWAYKSAEAILGLARVPDLLLFQDLPANAAAPTLAVIVPARDEEANVGACLRSLLAQDYPKIEIVAVDDRSTDGTGAVMEALAGEHPGRLRVVRVGELPAGWLGKTHAMALAARHTSADLLLFTDADVVYAPEALGRSVAYLVASGGDHLVTAPTPTIQRWDEAVVLGFFQVCGLWAARPWLVADPKARRDAIGVGAFNLVRRSAYLQVGGFEALRMEIIEDLGFARRIKKAGFAQRLAFGKGLVNIHWASGANGLAKVMTKNVFSAFRFHVSLVFVACCWLLGFCVAPTIGLFVPGFRLPALIIFVSILLEYRAIGRQSGIRAWNALLMPFGALLLVYALLRSMVTTLRQGGVVWRGTFYSLAELRKNAAPLKWF